MPSKPVPVFFVLATFATYVASSFRTASAALATADLATSYAKFRQSPVTIRTSASGPVEHAWKWAPTSGNVCGILSTHLPHVLSVISERVADPTIDVHFVVDGAEVTAEAFTSSLSAFIDRMGAYAMTQKNGGEQK